MKLFQFLAVASVAVNFATSPALASKPATPVPLANPGEWLTDNDYPKSALELGHEGTTGFLLTVNADGRVTSCKITVGSGWEVLDEATCRIVTERARFTPAQDRKGRAIAGTYTNRVRWTIPTEKRLPKEGLSVTTFVLSPDGKLVDCRVEVADGDAATKLTVGPMKACPHIPFPHGYFDENGKPVPKLLRYTYRIEVLDVPVDKPATAPVPGAATSPAPPAPSG